MAALRRKRYAGFTDLLLPAGGTTAVEGGCPMTMEKQPWPIGRAPKGCVWTHVRDVVTWEQGTLRRVEGEWRVWT